MSIIKATITEDMKVSMKTQQKDRLRVIRMIMAAFKQKEVDERIELDDTQVLGVLDKMVKQRRESEKQYRDNDRTDLADQEAYEIDVIQSYLPQALSEKEISDLIEAAFTETGATSMADMGKVMGALKPKIQGRADIGAVSAQVKARLSTS